MLYATLIERDGEPAQPPSRCAPREDCQLIAGVLQADPASEAVFISRYDRFIHAVLHRNLPGADMQEREDLRQQVYLLLWDNQRRRLRQWQGLRGTPFSAYLGTIVRHLVVDYLRSGSRSRMNRTLFSSCQRCVSPESGETELETPSLNGTGDPQGVLESKERQNALHAALAELSERDRFLVCQRHLYGRTYREIADALHITVNHVGVALARAETRLRRRLRNQDADLFPEIRESEAAGVINRPLEPSPNRVPSAASVESQGDT